MGKPHPFALIFRIIPFKCLLLRFKLCVTLHSLIINASFQTWEKEIKKQKEAKLLGVHSAIAAPKPKTFANTKEKRRKRQNNTESYIAALCIRFFSKVLIISQIRKRYKPILNVCLHDVFAKKAIVEQNSQQSPSFFAEKRLKFPPFVP